MNRAAASIPPWQSRLGVTPQEIERFCQRWGLSEFSFFGSVTRDDFRDDSDVDVLVRLDPTKPHGGWDWVDMIEELKTMFGRNVDLTSPRILENPYRRASIERDMQVIYGA
jgi:predicted nucleotidyltransferase